VNYRLLSNTLRISGGDLRQSGRQGRLVDQRWLRSLLRSALRRERSRRSGIEEMVKDMSVGALAYDTVPLSTTAKLDYSRPSFNRW